MSIVNLFAYFKTSIVHLYICHATAFSQLEIRAGIIF